MFEDIAKIWLDKWFESWSDEIVEDLAFTLMQVYEAGRNYGYDEGLEENLTELQW